MTPEQRQEIRDAYATGRVSRSTLAGRYGVSITAIDRAVTGIRRGKGAGQRLWADLPTGGCPKPVETS